MKTNGRARSWRVAGLIVAVVLGMGIPLRAQEGPLAALQVQATVTASDVRLDARANGPFEYSTFRASDSLYVVEMSGVTLDGSGAPRVLNSELVSGYRLLPYRSMGHSVVRLEILLRRPVAPRVERVNAQNLVVTFAAPVAAAAAEPRMQPAAVRTTHTAPAKESAATVSASPAHPTIQGVSLEKEDGQVVVRISATAKLEYQAIRLNKPERLVLDFNGATVGRWSKPHSVAEPVGGVRASQFKPDMARIVIDLDRNASYQIASGSSGLEVKFAPLAAAQKAAAQPAKPSAPAIHESAPASTEAAPVAPATVPAAPAEAAASVPAARAKVQAPAAILVSASDPTEFSAPTVAIDASSMSLPTALTGESEALASPKRDDTPSNAAGTNPAPATASTASAAPAATAPAASAEPAAPVADPYPVDPSQSGGAKKFSGEPISVNLKDVDLKDFFRLIHEISGLNVVLDPAVRGNLTLVLDDVPWDQALDIVLQNNNLDKQLQGNVLRIATKDTLKKEAETARDLAKALTESVPAVTATRQLSYAKASSLRDTLRRFLSSRGEILADDRANMLIIRDIPAVFPDLDALIKTLDKKSQQVEIEARVVSATRTFSREIGVQFGFSGSATNGRNIFGGLPGLASFVSPLVRGPALPPPPLTSNGTTQMPFITNYPANAPETGVSYAFSSPNAAVDLIITAAEDRGVGKLLSRPKIVTQNNVAGTIKQGTKIPVQTVINNTISTQFIDAVLQLQVTPQITADGTIFMAVNVENDQPDFSHAVQGIPSIITQSADTRVLANDGGTVVIGGIIISSQTTTINQTPLVGSIPLIGHLFKHTAVSTSSSELLFFITPRIIPT